MHRMRLMLEGNPGHGNVERVGAKVGEASMIVDVFRVDGTSILVIDGHDRQRARFVRPESEIAHCPIEGNVLRGQEMHTMKLRWFGRTGA